MHTLQGGYPCNHVFKVHPEYMYLYIYICSIYNIINTVYLKPLNKLRIRLGILYMHGSLSSLLNERDRTVAVDGIHSVRVTDRSAMFFGVLWAVHLRA